MNSITVTPDSKSFFPRAGESHTTVESGIVNKITSGKSDLANSILRAINTFKATGKEIDVDLSESGSTLSERNQIKLMLYQSEWTISPHIVKTPVPNWPLVEAAVDETLWWKISKNDKPI
jgi:hypothetical protein